MYLDSIVIGGSMDTAQGMIERGKILGKTKDGYTVASIDRDGIVTRPIRPINTEEYTIGNMVYFFMFKDGTGGILCEIS